MQDFFRIFGVPTWPISKEELIGDSYSGWCLPEAAQTSTGDSTVDCQVPILRYCWANDFNIFNSQIRNVERLWGVSSNPRPLSGRGWKGSTIVSWPGLWWDSGIGRFCWLLLVDWTGMNYLYDYYILLLYTIIIYYYYILLLLSLLIIHFVSESFDYSSHLPEYTWNAHIYHWHSFNMCNFPQISSRLVARNWYLISRFHKNLDFLAQS